MGLQRWIRDEKAYVWQKGRRWTRAERVKKKALVRLRSERKGRPIIAWRQYIIREGRIMGMRGHEWREPRLEAECLSYGFKKAHKTPAPELWCSCGIYAFKDAEKARTVMTGAIFGGTRKILAVVQLSGKVIEHAEGYRAQRAEVIACALRHGTDEIEAWPTVPVFGNTRALEAYISEWRL